MTIPTDLETYQQDVDADTLYYAKQGSSNDDGVVGNAERLAAGITVTGGTVNIYGSFHKPTTPTTDMVLDRSAFSGIDTFAIVPTYIYFETSTGSPVITVSSLEVEEVV